jgi:hypothetical protein
VDMSRDVQEGRVPDNTSLRNTLHNDIYVLDNAIVLQNVCAAS